MREGEGGPKMHVSYLEILQLLSVHLEKVIAADAMSCKLGNVTRKRLIQTYKGKV